MSKEITEEYNQVDIDDDEDDEIDDSIHQEADEGIKINIYLLHVQFINKLISI